MIIVTVCNRDVETGIPKGQRMPPPCSGWGPKLTSVHLMSIFLLRSSISFSLVEFVRRSQYESLLAFSLLETIVTPLPTFKAMSFSSEKANFARENVFGPKQTRWASSTI